MSDRRTAVHDSLREMADQNQLSPRNVVDQAREETNVLHPLFEWDDNIAADHHRLDQARRLISSFEVIVTRGENRYRVQEFIEDIRKPEDKQAMSGWSQLSTIVKLLVTSSNARCVWRRTIPKSASTSPMCSACANEWKLSWNTLKGCVTTS